MKEFVTFVLQSCNYGALKEMEMGEGEARAVPKP